MQACTGCHGKEGVSTNQGYFPRIAGKPALKKMESYLQGSFEIQDEGSQVMALFSLWPETFLPLTRKVPGKNGSRDSRIALDSRH